MSLDPGFAATGEWAPSGEWECMECGYIEEGAKIKRPPVCPDCGAPGQALEFFPYGDDEDEASGDLDGDLFDEVVDPDEEDRG